ncbi:hypothetical protein ACFX12_018830 [Malus domestica]
MIKFGLTSRTSAVIKKVHVTLVIPAECQPATNDGGKKRYSSPACKPSVEKKRKTSSATRGSSCVSEKLVIDLTSSKGAKMTVEPKPVKPTAPKVTASIAKRLAQRKGSVTLLVSRFVSKCLSGAKSGSTSKRFAAMKSKKVDYAVKVAFGPILFLP